MTPADWRRLAELASQSVTMEDFAQALRFEAEAKELDQREDGHGTNGPV